MVNVNQPFLLCFLLFAGSAWGQETQIQYLSGKGSDQTVDWQFYCTAGQNSGKWTIIPVPSNWEQGFGTYNYGLDDYWELMWGSLRSAGGFYGFLQMKALCGQIPKRSSMLERII